ncbi:MAG: 30S ribosomal protein S20 [Candidatus Wildermuthbacteria bacterium RIFCSPLOWO2_02_FULL_47_9c]|uniref:Small ribosomal subunit protein bS20 n=2 Tax=Candidatus Wildermuthiibacteriota TaxID=1817923 RepID=A0A1G2RSL7_9BACT|nr:MAG: 30S ribosomal protein S20 [Candidatus Wildermuthbacteria bacterium RIFCSPLOWO2_01_FULL_48_29]OHA75836.1 MAG: 30S ribosomal protein S20 [Candidatus Wildermuthbacteria bacterium RIFCSPLOWO2_02_FULL_47_9c]
MPITKSAKKALRQSIKRKARNLKRKAAFKALIKQEKKLLEQKNVEEAQKLLPQLYKALDKAALKGVLKPNTAARKKSRLTKLLQKTARLDARQAKPTK